MNDFSDAMEWIGDEMILAYSDTVTYRRGADSVLISAVSAPPASNIDTETTVVNTIRSRDWIIKASDLVLSGSAVKPEAGDTILDSLNRVYEVAEILGEPCWRYSDPHEQMIRVHTKESR